MNEAQIEYWNGPAAARWTERQAVLDRALQVFDRALLERAGARPGEQVLDVGCGCGDSAIALARAVQPGGAVTAVDISAAMLARARERAAGLDNLRFTQADASVAVFESAFDLVFSRFGAMFFEDPAAAFAHLRSGLRSSGRLAIVCWRAFDENPWATVPVEAVRRIWRDAPPVPSESGPGPYAFADREKLSAVLQAAGFHAIAIERFDADVILASDSVAAAASFAVEAGPAARLLTDAPGEVRDQVRAELTRTLEPHRSPAGFALTGSSWLVTARVEP